MTPIINKLCKIFENYTFTNVKTVEVNNKLDDIYYLSIPYSRMYLLGIGQIFVN